jgi:hypothetical protein
MDERRNIFFIDVIFLIKIVIKKENR